jgi:four helix bundle protein
MKRSFRELEVWNRALDFAIGVYDVTKSFPREERFGLTSQMRRAAISIPANIAEAYGRGSLGERRQFLLVARGSLTESETHVVVVERLGFVSSDRAKSLAADLQSVGRLLNGLLRYVDKQRK